MIQAAPETFGLGPFDDLDLVRHVVKELTAALPSGSYVVLSHATADLLPGDRREVYDRARSTAGLPWFTPRRSTAIAAVMGGLDIVEPGLVPTTQWKPDLSSSSPDVESDALSYAVAGRVR